VVCPSLIKDERRRNEDIDLGPVVWYQKFEYAIGHWLQKAAEHILGCVVRGEAHFDG
jgi:hypothetical protein